MQIRSDVMIVAGVLVCLLVPLLVYHKVRFKPVLTVQEKAVADFAPATLSIAKRVWEERPLVLPVTPPAPPAPSSVPVSGTGVPAAAAAPATRPVLPKISMILHDGSGGGTAVIDGTPLAVGGELRGWRLERIEGSRVLLRGQRGTVWVAQE